MNSKYSQKTTLKVSDIDTCRFHWSRTTLISSILFMLVIIFALIALTISVIKEASSWFALVLFIVIVGGVASRSPLGLVVDNDYIALKRYWGRHLINKKDIISIKEVDGQFLKKCHRYNGGNSLGYWGHWRHPEEGNLNVFLTDQHERLALIETSDKKYLINY